MLSFSAAQDRALRRAIETGELAEMSFIHSVQEAEGIAPCFGRMEGPCEKATCRWYAECMALLEVRAVSQEPVFA
jgi:hypothetical protein